MRKNLALLLFSSFFASHVNAQELLAPSPIIQRRDSVFTALRQAGVDSFCLFTGGCTGCHHINHNPCEAKGLTEPSFLFWRQHGRTYRLYLGNCHLQPAEVITTGLWAYFGQHQRALRTETIRPFHVRALPFPKRVRRNHGAWDAFQLVMPADTICQSISSFDLSEYAELRIGKHQARNLNYRRNRRTHAYQFLQLLAAAVQAPPVRQD